MTDMVLSSVLKPEYLTSNYKEDLLSDYKRKYESTGSELGYIVKVSGIKDIISSNISNNTEIIVESLCNCVIFKPHVGLRVRCSIDMIHVNGIFVSKYKIKILIPSSTNDYEYKHESFVVGDKEYRIGDDIEIEIVNIRYDKYIYSCIGKLILKD